MINFIVAFMRRQHDKAMSRQFSDGWNWAAGELLRGKTAEEVGESADCPFDNSAFDAGALAAIDTWVSREVLAEQEAGAMRLMTNCTCGGPENGGVTDYG